MTAKTGKDWPLPHAEPEEVGLSSDRLARIRPAMQKFVDQGMDPGFTTMVIRQGKVAWYDAQGYMDIQTRKTVGKDTIYRLWSNSKPITGVATMICVEEGLLTLDDPISKYIPAFKNPRVRVLVQPRTVEVGRAGAEGGMTPTVPADREVTIRDCLRNTTGFATAGTAPVQYLTQFPESFPGGAWFTGPMNTRSIKEAVDAQARLPLESQPGTRFDYQVGYPVVGMILEIATGRTLDEFYTERIFKPLGMDDTAFYLAKDKLDRFPVCYRPAQEGGKWKLEISDPADTSEKVTGGDYFEAGGGGGGVLSTIGDYARFSQMLLNGGELDGVRILGRRTVEVMTSSHTAEGLDIPLSGPGYGFGMGVGVFKGSVPPQLRSVGAFGWSGAAGTTCIMDPREQLIWLCFTQVMTHRMMPGNNPHEVFERLVYQSLI